MEPRPEITVTSFDEKEVNEYIEKLNQISSSYGADQAILIKIDSFGGSLHGLAHLYESLKTLRNPIVTYTSSKAMSAGAFLLATAASPGMRFASPNSSIMIHEASAGTVGHIDDMETDVRTYRAESDKWLTILAKSIGLNTIEQLKSKLRSRGDTREFNLTAQEAKELNIVDNVGYVDISPFVGYNINVTLTNPSTKKKRKSK